MKTHLIIAAMAAATFTKAYAADQYIFGFSGPTPSNRLVINDATSLPFLDQGWYFQNGLHTPSNNNYIVGMCDTCALVGEYRNWFAFDIAGISAPVTSATLLLYSYDVTLTSGNYYLNDFTGSVSSLIAGNGGVAAFNDLGTGVNFGFRFVQSATDSNQLFSISLNSGAVASLNAAIAAGATQWAFGGSFLAGEVPVPPPVPELGTQALLLSGLALGFAVLRPRYIARRRVGA